MRYRRGVSIFEVRADRVTRRLWPGLLPPPPVLPAVRPMRKRVARWCARFAYGRQFSLRP